MDNPIDENKIVSKFLVDSNQAVKFKLVRNEEEIQNDKVRFLWHAHECITQWNTLWPSPRTVSKPTQDDAI